MNRPLRTAVLSAALSFGLIGCGPLIANPPPTVEPWASLQRPLQTPSPTRGDGCGTTSVASIVPYFGPAAGAGPVYAVGLDGDGTLSAFSPQGEAKILWIARPEYRGRVLIRGRQLDGPNELQFRRGLSNPTSAELRLTAENGAGGEAAEKGWLNWPSYTIAPTSGCYLWQIDGESFSETIVFRVAR